MSRGGRTTTTRRCPCSTRWSSGFSRRSRAARRRSTFGPCHRFSIRKLAAPRWQAIQRRNNLANPNLILAGQHIVIPVR
uniref:LysM peptidoglycan-binding domain-containing protein n=1 Tax=Burkholderia cepacia TaxID=292 RepID=UPI0035BE15E2